MDTTDVTYRTDGLLIEDQLSIVLYEGGQENEEVEDEDHALLVLVFVV